jgi:hypothetical protein
MTTSTKNRITKSAQSSVREMPVSWRQSADSFHDLSLQFGLGAACSEKNPPTPVVTNHPEIEIRHRMTRNRHRLSGKSPTP